MRWKKWLENTASKFGFIIIPVWRAGRLDQERHLKRLLQHLDIDCVFDIGANVGQYGELLRTHAMYHGQILSFEPHPIAFNHLQKRAQKDGAWACFEYGFAAHSGTAVLHANSQSDLSSLKSMSESRGTIEDISITIKRLKDAMPQLRSDFQFKRPFLKMDTQGSELDIVLGAGEELKSFCAIQTEISFKRLYDDTPHYDEIIEFFESSGFKISRLCPIHEVGFPVLGDMDLFMINEKFL